MACSAYPETVSVKEKVPTYSFLIDLYHEHSGNRDEIISIFKAEYPDIYIGRPDRFYQTIEGIVLPTIPTVGRSCAIGSGSQLSNYRKQLWKPRLRNTSRICGTKFPEELCNYGLSEEVLSASFYAVQMGEKPKWHLRGIPNFDFYKSLHPFLKHWHVTKDAAKVTIGSFYIEIDENMKQKGSRPDNIYRFVDKAIKANSSAGVMTYHQGQFQKDVKVLQSNLGSCTKEVELLNSNMLQLKQQLEASRQELHVARCALRDVTNEKAFLEKQKDSWQKKLAKSKKARLCLEEEIASLHLENVDLSMALSDLERDLHEENFNCDPFDTEENFTFQTKNGKQYSPAIRKLYYTLLGNQVPTMKISEIIKSVVKCFNPSIDVEHLKLPQRSCASYMRCEEMKTICTAHNATTLCDQISQMKSFRLNTDGTTKFQKKIGALAINEMTISVNDLTDGSASTAVADVSKELEKLRTTARILRLPNPDSINWTLITTSTSDSATTKKHLNTLVEKCRREDELKFGAPQIEAFDLIENFCSMHLGINLRKAFLSGLKSDIMSQDRNRQQHPLDLLVHEFCKAFGQHGVPEYGLGRSFSDFLSLMTKQADTDELRTYYQQCCTIRLERQIGKRYFVTAANAAKIFFAICCFGIFEIH